MEVVQKYSFAYKMLREKFPNETEFYSQYIAGTYYSTDRTIYYDKFHNKLLEVNHGNYS